jgi:glucose-6-phosphate isomerase
MTPRELWERYRSLMFDEPALGFRLDLSRMPLDAALLEEREAPMQAAFAAMERLERGEIANPDEGRMVGHYWLRAPERAPSPEIRRAIVETQARVRDFAARVHDGRVRPPDAAAFRNLLVIGIGGSALGPELVADALGGPSDRLAPHFLDNTDPDGLDRVLGALGAGLGETLTVVISKSGGTPETRNGMVETSTVGLLPAALQGIDTGALLAGAAAMDEVTRRRETRRNPAALLALAWHVVGDGRGSKAMVVLPYKDRLALFSRYLQQLVMESLGKERDLDGRVVHQGLTVYGNKGSTDQHAYVQQLRDGTPDFFVTFVRVLRDREGKSIEVEEGVTSGDFLDGLHLGTRRALFESGRYSLTLTLPDVSPRSLGMLIALYERAVGLYASLIRVNAYHQPGVEAGKKAAAGVLELQRRALAALAVKGTAGATCAELASAAGAEDEVETVFHVMERLAANPERGVSRRPGRTAFDAIYALAPR